MVDGRKENSLKNRRLRITRMVLMVDGRKEYSLENGRLRITRMVLMLGMRKEHSLENTRLRITRMALMVGMRKAHSLENGRLRITRIVLMLDGRKAHSLENVRLRITRMERMWVTRILVWGYLGDYAPPCGGGDGGGATFWVWFRCKLTIYSPCYHFIGLPFSSFLDSEATLTSKSAVVLLSSTNFFPSHFLTKAKPEEIG